MSKESEMYSGGLKIGSSSPAPDATPRDGNAVNHPSHYGGSSNPYEAIKVIEAWGVGFNLGNTLKYIARADFKDSPVTDLEKAAWYLNREIKKRKGEL